MSASVAHDVANTAAGGQSVRGVPRATTRSPSCWHRRHALQQPGVNADHLTGKTFFPHLITEPFHSGLIVVFVAAAIMMLLGALASMFNPGRYAEVDED